MLVMDPSGDPDVLRVWALLTEVSEQVGQNRAAAVNLHALADGTKVRWLCGEEDACRGSVIP